MAEARYKVLDLLLIPRAGRNAGRGSDIMTKLCGWADVEGVTLVLSADSTVCGRTGSASQDWSLKDFYSRFGFFSSNIRGLKTDSLVTNKNIMERTPQPVLSGHIAILRDLECESETL